MSHEEYGYDIPSGERPGILGRLVRLNRYLLALLIVPAGVIYFWPPFEEQEAASQRLAELVHRRDSLRSDVRRLEQKLELIKTDPDYLEVMARDRLHLQKEGEVILRFEE